MENLTERKYCQYCVYRKSCEYYGSPRLLCCSKEWSRERRKRIKLNEYFEELCHLVYKDKFTKRELWLARKVWEEGEHDQKERTIEMYGLKGYASFIGISTMDEAFKSRMEGLLRYAT